MEQLAINSTTAVAAEARVNPARPTTAVVEFMAKWLNLYLRTVRKIKNMKESEFVMSVHGTIHYKPCNDEIGRLLHRKFFK